MRVDSDGKPALFTGTVYILDTTPAQLRVIAKTFNRVAVVFDDEPQATEQAYRLVEDLKFRNVDAFFS